MVPTEYHWEAAYVAPVMPLARGWERQLDVADNPIFYRSGALAAGTYRAWLLDDGVTFVALPDAPLDSAGQAEGRLVSSGQVPGLDLIWRSAHWRLYSVAGSQRHRGRPGPACERQRRAGRGRRRAGRSGPDPDPVQLGLGPLRRLGLHPPG